MEEKKTKINLDNGDPRTIHTYLSDMAETVRNNEISVIKISAEEQKRKEQEALYKKAEGTGLTKTLFTIGGLILLTGSIFGIYFLINKKNEVVAPVVIKEDNLISTNNTTKIEYIETDSEIEILEKIKNELQKTNKEETINTITIEKKNIAGVLEKLTTKDFLEKIGLNPEPSMVRALDSKYEIGFYNHKENSENISKNLFLIFNVKDYNQVYADMLKWERKLITETYNLFNINIEGDNITILEKPFYDIVINNKDARVMYDKDNNGILYYIFLDKNTLLITQSKESIKEINSRISFKK
jgi:hypothetical protein